MKDARTEFHLSIYNVYYHSNGYNNVCADLLGRWSTPLTVRRLLFDSPLVSASDDESVWPKRNGIACARNTTSFSRPKHLTHVYNLWRNVDGAVGILANEDHLQLRLCVIAHSSAADHRGFDTPKLARQP